MINIKISTQQAKLVGSLLLDSIGHINDYINNHKDDYNEFCKREKLKQLPPKQRRQSRKKSG